MKKTNFNMSIYTLRRRDYDNYSINFTKTGWYVSHMTIFGDCDRFGQPFLYKNFDQDGVIYHNTLGEMLEHLWHSYDQDLVTYEEVSEHFSKLAKYLKAINENENRVGFIDADPQY